MREKSFRTCSKEEKIKKIQECGLYLEDPGTWTDENRRKFCQRNPDYEVIFEEVSHVVRNGTDVSFTDEPSRLVVVPKGIYETKMEFGYSDEVGYSYIKLRKGLGDDIHPEAPFNASNLFHTFSESDAKRIDISGWDISDCDSVASLFSGNSIVEKIDMRGVKFPEAEESEWFDKTDFGSMYKGCSNLKSLVLETGPSNCRFTSDEYVRNSLTECFEGCRKLEYVYFSGGPFWESYLPKIISASEKKVTIDGEFEFEDWVRYHGGLRLGISAWNILLDAKMKLVEEPGRTDINFVGKVIIGTIERYEAYLEHFNEKGNLFAGVYAPLKKYLQELKEKEVLNEL